jgi:GT2 family glycosyltransferase
MTPPVTALVLTYRRPRLATQTVRWLIDDEGIAPEDVVLVVNGDGGLDDDDLQAQIEVLALPENLGPAGGFARGLRHVRDTRQTPWIYLCEDDIALYDLPTPRTKRLIDEAAALEQRGGAPIGAVVAYGRDVDRHNGRTIPHAAVGAEPLEDIGMGQWGATLLSRRVLDAGVFPDESLFWGWEDLDFFLSTRGAGFRVLVDTECARVVHGAVTRPARTTWKGVRPNRKQEPWTRYYAARNFFPLARRHGDWRWRGRHAATTAHRLWLAGSRAERSAIVRGFLDGIRRRDGKNPSFVRNVGEL